MKKTAFLLLIANYVLCSCSHKQVSTEAERTAWHHRTLMEAYQTIGHHNAKWDEPATNALMEYARSRAGSSDVDTLIDLTGDSAQEAVHAGCDDPLIRYLYCRFAPDRSSKPLKYWQDEFQKTARDMEASSYAPVLKFHANDRAAEMLWQNYDKAAWQQVAQLRRAAMDDLTAALQDKSLPLEEIADACDTLINTLAQNDKEITDAWTQIQEPLFKNWPDTATVYFVKGRFYDRFAWQARGSGYADKVTEEGWAGFRKNLAVADTAFRKAWSLNPKDPRIPTEMIAMAISLEKKRPEMELWFQRAMQLDPNNYAACASKLQYLEPKWNGTREDMLAFGRECVASNWGGRVPLILVDAHSQSTMLLEKPDRAAYWRLPDVWPDLQSAYEKYFQVNARDRSRTRYYYARFAFMCGQWQAFKEQIKIIRDSEGTLNTAFFGGDEVFNKMVERADSPATEN